MTQSTSTAPRYDLARVMAEAAERRAARAEQETADLLAQYPHIVRVTATGGRGQPTRVEIRCLEPMQRQGVSVCEGTREIATQDLFQVRQCRACRARADRIAARAKAKARLARQREDARRYREGER